MLRQCNCFLQSDIDNFVYWTHENPLKNFVSSFKRSPLIPYSLKDLLEREAWISGRDVLLKLVMKGLLSIGTVYILL